MEFLKAILGEELFSSFSEKVSEYNNSNPDKAVKIADLSTGLYVDKHKYDDAISDIQARDATIGQLKPKAESVDSLTQQLNALQTKYDTDTGNLNKQLSKVQFDSALDVALAGSGAKNTKALRALLDMDKITFEDGKLNGFSEQLETVKSENGYLFDGGTPSKGGLFQGGSGGSTDAFLTAARDAAGLSTT